WTGRCVCLLREPTRSPVSSKVVDQRRGAADCSKYRKIAGAIEPPSDVGRAMILAVNPQTDQVKDKDTDNNGCQNDKRPHQPIRKGALGRHALVHSELLFPNRRSVFIFDPSGASLGSLVLDNRKCKLGIIGQRSNRPSRHGCASARPNLTRWTAKLLGPNGARRIAANIATLT